VFLVYLFDQVTGTLAADRGRLRFQYHEAAIQEPRALPISVRMPKRAEPYDDEYARPFFENLLPEGEYHRLLARVLGISEANTVGLLGAIAGECAGAVSVWPTAGGRPTKPSYRALADKELGDLFAAPDELPLVGALREGRLSLAGAQAKLTLAFRDGKWQLPTDGGPTTHILKRTRKHFAYLVENEFFCMNLAAAAGLPVPETFVVNVGIPLLAIRRFDRPAEGPIIRRLHQEDFCQASGVLPAAKYESEGGPGLALCAEILNKHSAFPLVDVQALVRWVTFNYLIGNEDAHAKNLALLYGPEGIRLAPFYDLVSTTVYRGLKRKAAMRIGTEYRYSYVRARHWARMSGAMRLPERAVMRLVLETVEAVLAALEPATSRSTQVLGDVPLVQAIIHHVQTRAAQARAEAAALPTP
jgi:serine/threonine-protein kinase HipA